MAVRALIFDIGGTVFDWNTAMAESFDRLIPGGGGSSFATQCRAEFLGLNAAVFRKVVPWMTAEQILLAAIDRCCDRAGLSDLAANDRNDLSRSWRRMPCWPGAREAIAVLRKRYIVAPLTILSWPMAVGSSRHSGIDWDSILSCDVLGIYKPDPRCYQRAAEILDCPASDIMMVASHPSDLRGAMASGYRSAYVVPRLEDPGDDYRDTGFAAEFDVIARDFSELGEKLDGGEGSTAAWWRS